MAFLHLLRKNILLIWIIIRKFAAE